jgi:hypothetical protein
MSFNNIEISKDSFFLLTKPKNYIGIVYLVNHIFFLFIFGLLTIFIYDYSIIFSLLSYLIYCQIFNFLSTDYFDAVFINDNFRSKVLS